MGKARASKGLLITPASQPNFSAERRQKWLDAASKGFVSTSPSNKEYYRIILEALWPENHGIPGPHVSEKGLRAAVDSHRAKSKKGPYKDVFRRVRELQGEEGYTSVIKEGVKYQLQSLEVGAKREPRAKPSPALWRQTKEKFDFRCSHCGAQEPDIKLGAGIEL